MHTDREIKQMWQNVNIWQIRRSFRVFVALCLQLFCYIYFFQIKSFGKCPSVENKCSSHATEGGTRTLGNTTQSLQFLHL